MPDSPNRGLYSKYQVKRTDGKPLVGQAIVLEVKDPRTWPALLVWADTMRQEGFGFVAEDVEALVMMAKQGRYITIHGPEEI